MGPQVSAVCPAALVLIVLIVFVVRAAIAGFSGKEAGSPQAEQAGTASPAQAGQQELSPEEAAAQQAAAEEEQQIQAVVDSYQNLGIVQVSGYLNIREEPSLDGTIIGKLSGMEPVRFSAQRGSGPTSPPARGGLYKQSVSHHREEARQMALGLVKLRATVTTDNVISAVLRSLTRQTLWDRH